MACVPVQGPASRPTDDREPYTWAEGAATVHRSADGRCRPILARHPSRRLPGRRALAVRPRARLLSASTDRYAPSYPPAPALVRGSLSSLVDPMVLPCRVPPPHPREGHSCEAHLPAQQPPPRSQARLPIAHEHSCRTFDRPEPAPSRPGEADGLTVASVTPDRLRDGRDISAVLRGRRQRAGRLCVLHLGVGPGDGVRVAVVASRRVGHAVARNRAKRLLREAARCVPWRPGTDVVLVARAAASSSSFQQVRDEVVALATALDASTSSR